MNSNTINTDKKNIQKTNARHRATLSLPATQHTPELLFTSPPSSPPAQNRAWYRMAPSTPFVWPVGVSQPRCVPSWLLVNIYPVLAEPRTSGHNTQMDLKISLWEGKITEKEPGISLRLL